MIQSWVGRISRIMDGCLSYEQSETQTPSYTLQYRCQKDHFMVTRVKFDHEWQSRTGSTKDRVSCEGSFT